MIKTHPFKPWINKKTRKLIVGTLPPETAKVYFSNSRNTRLWDILRAVALNADQVTQGGNDMSENEKAALLEKLGLGISDIILKYDRTDYTSTKDKDIIPLKYFSLLDFAIENNVTDLLFVYQSAYKWFEHSLLGVEPVKIQSLKGKYPSGLIRQITHKGFVINCIILPQPLNRGKIGETLPEKLKTYKKWIFN